VIFLLDIIHIPFLGSFIMISRFLVRRDSDDYGDQRAFLGQEDLATFGVINVFVISIFVCCTR
jgi:hypothetical protein